MAFGAGKAAAFSLSHTLAIQLYQREAAWSGGLNKTLQDSTQLKGNFTFYQPGLETFDLHLFFC